GDKVVESSGQLPVPGVRNVANARHPQLAGALEDRLGEPWQSQVDEHASRRREPVGRELVEGRVLQSVAEEREDVALALGVHQDGAYRGASGVDAAQAAHVDAERLKLGSRI